MNLESSLAESVFRSKYLIEGETEPDQSDERLIKEFIRNFPEMEAEAREYITKQWYIPAGGVRRASGNPNKNVSHINCTTLAPVEDNLESIFDSLYKWAKFSAFGQGEGIDISLLRPKGAKVHNSSKFSTGAVSFMYLYDAVLKVIAQQGRRGASLISIKDDHPDILDFIKVKDKPESDKSRIDTANISIQTSDEFMKCVEEDKEWILRFENKYEVIENKVRAREVFEEICKMAWKRGDPGLQFIDKAKRESNSDSFHFNITGTNACCLTPDIIISTEKGDFPIKEIVERFNKGEDFLIKSYDINTKTIEYLEAENAFLSGRDQEILEISIIGEDDITRNIKCTPDHLFYTSNRGYIKAKDLLETDDLIIS